MSEAFLGCFFVFIGVIGSISLINKYNDWKVVLILVPTYILFRILSYLMPAFYGVDNVVLVITSGAIIGCIFIYLTRGTAKRDINNQSYQTYNSVKYCSNCGAEIDSNAVICVKCGCAIQSRTDVPSTGLNIISFLLPIIGLILYIIYHQNSPRKAGAIGKWSLIGFIVNLICIVISSY